MLIARTYWIICCFVPWLLYLGFGYLIEWEEQYEYASLAWMLADDFFYYLKIADNILKFGLSTFDGTTLTNGYHPLWMIVILCLGKLMGGFDEGFFILFRIILIILSLWTGVLLLQLCRQFFAKVFLRYAVFIFCYYLITRTSFAGMEFAISSPLLLLFISLGLTPTNKSWVLFGFVACLLIFSRVDLLMFVLPFIIFTAIGDYDFLNRKYSKNIVVAMIICIFPFLAYAVFNKIIFDSWIPLSGLAKQLKNSLFPSIEVLKSLYFPTSYSIIAHRLMPLISILTVSGCCIYSWKRLIRKDIPFLYIMIYPIFYFGLLIVIYDWPLDEWYMLPLFTALIFVAYFLDKYILLIHNWKKNLIYGLALVMVIFATGIAVSRITQSEPGVCYHSALALRDFAKKHSGKIGLGDRAGLASFINDQPIFQLEGLVNDRNFIEHLRNEDDLVKVLQKNKVQYYAVVYNVQEKNGSYFIYEPGRPGPMAKKMRGVLHSPPIYVNFFRQTNTRLIIFKVPFST
jgi:hypothetical protein